MRKFKALIVLAFVLAPSFVQSQNLDSLYAVFSDSKGAIRISVANEIVKYAYENDFIDSLITLKTGDEEEFVNATVHEAMGSYFMYEKGDHSRSNDFYKLILPYYEKSGNAVLLNLMNTVIGTNYYRMGDYENAVRYKMKCYEWERSVGNTESLSTTLNDLGVIYSQWNKPEMAINFFEEAEKVERPLNRPLQYANRLSALAKEYINIDVEKALPLIKEALQYDEKIEIPRQKEDRIATHQSIMGDIYFALDSLGQAADCYQKSFDFFEKIGQPYYMSTLLMQTGRLKIKSKQYSEAIAPLKRCLEIAEKNNYLRIQRDACLFLSEAYSRLESNSTNFYLRKYTILNDSLFRATSQQQINDFQVKYETAEKQLEIERQQSEIEHQRIRLLIITGGLIISFLLLAMLVYIVVLRSRRNRQLSEINALKDKFFSIISHDLKNPVIAQREALQTLAAYAHQLDADTLSDFFRKLLKSADSLAELLKNLLAWASIQTSREIYQPVPFNLIAALQPDLELVKDMAERKKISFETQMPPIAVLTADANMLVTVVRNLLANAVKFTELGGAVSLQIGESKGKYSVSVSDTGLGMTQEQIQDLFRIDRQHLREGTAGEQSSGLGLIVCRDMLHKHGCVLYVESEEGKGSRFWFEI